MRTTVTADQVCIYWSDEDGNLHRIGGQALFAAPSGWNPAFYYTSGSGTRITYFYIHGKYYDSEADYWREVKRLQCKTS